MVPCSPVKPERDVWSKIGDVAGLRSIKLNVCTVLVTVANGDGPSCVQRTNSGRR
jgi:hypothetical protein